MADKEPEIETIVMTKEFYPRFVRWIESLGLEISGPIPDGENGTFRVISPKHRH